MGYTPQDSKLVTLALNFVSDEWQVFVQSILDRASFPNWDEMWGALKQEELRRDLVKVKLDESSSGSKPKEEKNVAFALKGQQEQQRRKKDISKIKCFMCGEMGQYTTQCPLR